jgi:hypothetical protein
MKIFIFQRLDKVSYNYHEEGGLVVVAENAEQVKELIEKEGNIEITDKEWKDVITYELMDNEKPRVFVFPDAGCC